MIGRKSSAPANWRMGWGHTGAVGDRAEFSPMSWCRSSAWGVRMMGAAAEIGWQISIQILLDGLCKISEAQWRKIPVPALLGWTLIVLANQNLQTTSTYSKILDQLFFLLDFVCLSYNFFMDSTKAWAWCLTGAPVGRAGGRGRDWRSCLRMHGSPLPVA